MTPDEHAVFTAIAALTTAGIRITQLADCGTPLCPICHPKGDNQ